jgi:hypothetical protein
MLVKTWKRGWFTVCACLALLLLGASLPTAAQEVDANGLTFEDRSVLQTAVGKWIKEQAEGSENAQGKKTKRGYASRDFRPQGDGTYNVTVHLETAGDDTKTTERYLLVMRRSGDDWEVVEHELKDSFAGMHRESGAQCVSFDSMSFEREGLFLRGGSGTLCKTYFQDGISSFGVQAADMTYRFEPPDYATALHLQPDFHALYDVMKKDHGRELEFKPQAFIFECDPDTCDELIKSCFEGINDDQAGPLVTLDSSVSDLPSWARPLFEQTVKERQATPFAHFREPTRPGNKFYSILVLRQIDPFQYPGFEEGLFDISSALPGPGVLFKYNNWGGFELSFDVYPRSLIDPEQLFGPMYGWYTEETQRNSTPYELETRDDLGSRWHQVETLNGTVDMGTEDPETLAADITFGIELKQPLRILPFFIQAIPTRSATGKNKARELFVNSVQLDGEELTWVRTSQLGGLVVLPEEMPAGTKINLRMDFKTRAMVRYTYSFTVVSRFGWMPFVRFGDFIDEFELTVKAPSKYEVLGIGHKVDSKTEGSITTTRWIAESPIVFPSMTLGRYKSNTAGKKFQPATKSDGTPIPIVVHVDEASALDWDITTGKLQPIAQQATNAINLYTEISGLDYPYGKLDFVNDPQGFLYGQAPSSIIYLGQGVFRGEGFLAPFFADAAGIAKFLKSVVAHEVGHQWWGSRVSNANDRNYWFVETLAEYFSALYLEAVYGKKEYLEQVEEWRRNILDANLKSSVQNASVIWSGEGGNYQAAVYNKGPFAFHMLREIFGDERFFPFLKKFSQDLDAKREIVTMDIQQAAEENLGGIGPDGKPYTVDLSWFFDQWIRGSGAPQYRLDYDVRQAEDRSWIIEGTISQRVIVGNRRSDHVLEGTFYRGVANLTVKTGKNEYKQRLIIEGQQTPFQLKVPEKPLEVILNKHNDILSHDVQVNRGAW